MITCHFILGIWANLTVWPPSQLSLSSRAKRTNDHASYTLEKRQQAKTPKDIPLETLWRYQHTYMVVSFGKNWVVYF